MGRQGGRAEILLEFTLWLKKQTPLVTMFPGLLEATTTPHPHVHPWQKPVFCWYATFQQETAQPHTSWHNAVSSPDLSKPRTCFNFCS